MKKFKIVSEIDDDAYFLVNISDFEVDIEEESYDISDVIGAERFNLHVHTSYIHKLLMKLFFERQHAYMVGYTLKSAGNNLSSIIADSADKYGRIINLYETELDNMLGLDRITTKETSSDTEGSTNEDAATDSTLHKFNDTPNSGDNPDLLADTYLSSSDRNTYNIGERKRLIEELRTQTELLNDSDNIAKLEAVGRLQLNISNIFDEWLNYIDDKALVYDMQNIV